MEHDAGVIYAGVIYLPAEEVKDAGTAAPPGTAPAANADFPVVVSMFTWDLHNNADGVRAMSEVGRAACETAVHACSSRCRCLKPGEMRW